MLKKIKISEAFEPIFTLHMCLVVNTYTHERSILVVADLRNFEQDFYINNTYVLITPVDRFARGTVFQGRSVPLDLLLSLTR